jgi:predicted O-methyltransferase YrrM
MDPFRDSLIAGLIVFLIMILRKCSKLLNAHAGRTLLGRWPLPVVDLVEIDPLFAENELGVSRDIEVRFLGGASPSSPSTMESWILAVLSKRALNMFEFGTCTGHTTYVWGLNSSEQAKITTLTLTPDHFDSYQVEEGDDQNDMLNARNESRFQDFLYSNTPVEHKITQLFGDSKIFDPSPYENSMDLIFIDGSHAASYVMSDTSKALRMLKPGGIILWHDYHAHITPGVFKTLNTLCDQLNLKRITNTTLAYHRNDCVEQSYSIARAA